MKRACPLTRGTNGNKREIAPAPLRFPPTLSDVWRTSGFDLEEETFESITKNLNRFTFKGRCGYLLYRGCGLVASWGKDLDVDVYCLLYASSHPLIGLYERDGTLRAVLNAGTFDDKEREEREPDKGKKRAAAVWDALRTSTFFVAWMPAPVASRSETRRSLPLTSSESWLVERISRDHFLPKPEEEDVSKLVGFRGLKRAWENVANKTPEDSEGIETTDDLTFVLRGFAVNEGEKDALFAGLGDLLKTVRFGAAGTLAGSGGGGDDLAVPLLASRLTKEDVCRCGRAIANRIEKPGSRSVTVRYNERTNRGREDVAAFYTVVCEGTNLAFDVSATGIVDRKADGRFPFCGWEREGSFRKVCSECNGFFASPPFFFSSADSFEEDDAGPSRSTSASAAVVVSDSSRKSIVLPSGSDGFLFGGPADSFVSKLRLNSLVHVAFCYRAFGCSNAVRNERVYRTLNESKGNAVRESAGNSVSPTSFDLLKERRGGDGSSKTVAAAAISETMESANSPDHEYHYRSPKDRVHRRADRSLNLRVSRYWERLFSNDAVPENFDVSDNRFSSEFEARVPFREAWEAFASNRLENDERILFPTDPFRAKHAWGSSHLFVRISVDPRFGDGGGRRNDGQREAFDDRPVGGAFFDRPGPLKKMAAYYQAFKTGASFVLETDELISTLSGDSRKEFDGRRLASATLNWLFDANSSFFDGGGGDGGSSAEFDIDSDGMTLKLTRETRPFDRRKGPADLWSQVYARVKIDDEGSVSQELLNEIESTFFSNEKTNEFEASARRSFDLADPVVASSLRRDFIFRPTCCSATPGHWLDDLISAAKTSMSPSLERPVGGHPPKVGSDALAVAEAVAGWRMGRVKDDDERRTVSSEMASRCRRALRRSETSHPLLVLDVLEWSLSGGDFLRDDAKRCYWPNVPHHLAGFLTRAYLTDGTLQPETMWMCLHVRCRTNAKLTATADDDGAKGPIRSGKAESYVKPARYLWLGIKFYYDDCARMSVYPDSFAIYEFWNSKLRDRPPDLGGEDVRENVRPLSPEKLELSYLPNSQACLYIIG
jgi:hypothetical protein